MLLLVRPRDLPPEFRAWLDPSQPLPGAVGYLRRVVATQLVIALFLAIPFAFGLVLAAIDLLKGRWDSENSYILAVFVSPFLLHLPFYLGKRKLERELARGARRMGLFLTRDQVLLQLYPEECSLLPRDRVVRFDTVRVSRGKHGSQDLRLVFHEDDGTLSSFSIDPGDLDAPDLTLEELCRRLEDWRVAGGAGIDLTPSRAGGPWWQEPGTLRVETTKLGGADVLANWIRTGLEITAEIQLSRGKFEFLARHHGPDGLEKDSHSYTFEEFLAGTGQPSVSWYLGPKVLEDVIATVTAMKAARAAKGGKSRR